ncbi:short transient receptor potential channel 6-like [Anneissia japonica]|uniref:short transient receptor potential channel 6-like n=1 Tax=Anneissia japonica TaxID=1529436 RepID=UPI0014256D8F|nr:short transient receptor potential channel 6-like [Anneissia japonica]
MTSSARTVLDPCTFIMVLAKLINDVENDCLRRVALQSTRLGLMRSINQYRDLSKQCKKYASDLLEMCQSTEDVETLLNMDGTTLENVTDDNESKETGTLDLGRVKQAIIYKQKAFVAHPHCQHLLATLWYKGMPGWRQGNIVYKSIMTLLVFLTLPVLAFIYIIAPHSRIGKFVRTPLVKFIVHSGTYLIYLSLLFFQSKYTETIFNNGDHLTDEDFYTFAKNCSALDDWLNISPNCGNKYRLLRFTRPNAFDIIIIIFLVGMFWNELKQVWLEGSRIYLSSFWNWLDIAILNLYFTSFILKFVSYHSAQKAIDYFNDPDACEGLESNSSVVNRHIYYLSSDRKCWDPHDPVFLAEGLYALANVISFTRVTEVLAASEFLGPLQISLGRMLGDILRFGIVFGLVFVAFLCAMYNLYWYHPISVIPGQEVENAFGSISNTFLTLFWALFGSVSRDIPIVLSSVDDCYSITEIVGTILFALYHVVMVLVMLNMLIAMMSNSYQEIENDEDVEWKFARAQLWISYFDNSATLPIPFNLIPSPKSCLYIYKWFKGFFKAKEPIQNIPMRTRARSSLSDRRNGVFHVMGSGFRQSGEDKNQVNLKRWGMEISRLVETGMLSITSFFCKRSWTRAVSQLLILELLMRALELSLSPPDIHSDPVSGFHDVPHFTTIPLERELDEIKNNISSLRFELIEQLSHQPRTLAPANSESFDNEDSIKNKLASIEQTMGNLSNRIDELRDDLVLPRSDDCRDINIEYKHLQNNEGHVNPAYVEHASELEKPDYV